MRRLPYLFACLVLTTGPGLADAPMYPDESIGREEMPASSTSEPPPNEASDASFDPRLPPVLPGEEINDSGRKTKVWSTSGPVPVGQAPEPWRKRSIDDIDVIVDDRPHSHGRRKRY